MSISLNRNRCLLSGLGGSMCRRENWKRVDRPGDEATYKLSGANGSVSYSSSVCQGHGDSGSPGQHDSSSIYKSLGGNEDTGPLFTRSPCVGMVPSEVSLLSSIPHSRCQNTRVDLRVLPRCSQQTRLAGESRIVQEDRFSVGPIVGGPLCLQNLWTDREVLQLEAGSSSRRGRCFQSGLDQHYRLCQPSMEPSSMVYTKSPQSTSYNCSHNSTLANSGMASSSSNTFCRQSKTSPSACRSLN